MGKVKSGMQGELRGRDWSMRDAFPGLYSAVPTSGLTSIHSCPWLHGYLKCDEELNVQCFLNSEAINPCDCYRIQQIQCEDLASGGMSH